MIEMQIMRFVVGPLGVNAYIVYTEQHGEKRGFIVDPGEDASLLLQYIKTEKIILEAILNTHGHGDHIGAIDTLRDATGAKLYMHEGDVSMLDDPAKNMSLYYGLPVTAAVPDVTLHGGGQMEIAGLQVQVISTPGHTAGGVCYLVQGCLFSGDSLFRASVGRTDFPGSSHEALIESLQEKLLILPGDTEVYPGHGRRRPLHMSGCTIFF